MFPKPLHSGQAPSGWLNEKSRGWGRARATSQRGQRNSRLTERGPCPTTSTTARPSPSARAASSDSVNRRRASGPTTTRSSTTCTGWPSREGAASPWESARSTMVSPILMRAKPRCRRAAMKARGSGRGCGGRGKQTMARGGRAHRGARGANGVLLLEGDGGADVLDPVHVGPVEPLEEHARVGGEGLDVAPLTLGEDRVEGEGGLARARDARDDGDAVVGDGQGNVLQVVLPGSLDPEPEGLRHSVRPPEMESLPEHAPSRQPDRLDGTGATCFAILRCERSGKPSTYTHVRLGLPARSRLVWLATCPSAQLDRSFEGV